ARPKGDIKFHARRTEEAVHVEADRIALALTGARSGGEPYRETVYVPQAFPYLMMKLHAFDDRKDEEAKDAGRHHALDLYTIVGMMTEPEYERAKELGSMHADNLHVRRARQIVQNHFSGADDLGMLRVREHKLFRPDFRLGEFGAVLREIFPTPRPG